MEKELKIKTSFCKEEEEEALEDLPVSPTGQYLNSSVLSLTILAVLETEDPIDDSQLMPILRAIFSPINPRFSSIMINGNNGEKQWKRVEVNLEDHVIIPTLSPNSPLELYDDHFDEYLTKVAMDPLPQNRPLWEIHVVKYPTSKGAGHIIFKLHHALGDGYSLMGTLLSCLQRSDDPSLPLTFPVFQIKQSTTGYFRRTMTSVPKAIYVAYNTICDYGWSFLKSSVLEDDKTPIRSANEGLEHKPMQISTLEFPLVKIKQIKSELGVTVNDVVSSVIFHGVRLYMRGRSENWASSHSTALVLMNTRNIGGYKSVSEMSRVENNTKTTLWGNQFAFLHTSIPEFSDNDEFLEPLKFVSEAKRILQKKKSSLAFKLTAQTLEIMRRCVGPEAASGLIHKTVRNASLVLTNLVGPVEKIAIANKPVKGLYFTVAGGPLSLVITVVSYMQTLRIGIGVEKNFIDLKEFKSCVEQAFELTFDAATKKGR